MVTPGETAVTVVIGDQGPRTGVAVTGDLDQQVVGAQRVREPQIVLVADRDVAGGHVEHRRDERHRAVVHVGVAVLVLRQEALPAPVAVGGRVVVPARVVDGDAAVPIAAGGALVGRRPPGVGFEVVREQNRLGADHGRVEGCRRIGRVVHDAADGALGAEVELRRVGAVRGREGRLVQVAALGLQRHGQEGAAVIAVVKQLRVGDERLADRRDLHVNVRWCIGRQKIRCAVRQPDEQPRVHGAGAGQRECLRALRDAEAGHLDGPGTRCRVVHQHLLDVVRVVGLVPHGVHRGIERVERPREERAAGSGDQQIEVVDKGGIDVGRAGHVVPRERHLELGRAGRDLDLEELGLALAQSALGEVAGPHELDGGLDPHRSVPELKVRPGVAAVLRGAGEDRLHRRVA